MGQSFQIIFDIIESSIANLQINEDKINKLNVFPVPDGDTGSNMLATLLSAWNGLDFAKENIIEVMDEFAKNSLLGARGNSGVIVSQILRGFAEGVKIENGFSSDLKSFRNILSHAKNFAYKAVEKPIEGTILSIVKALDEKYNREQCSILEAWKEILAIAKVALDNTPNQLPILKSAGVVDSGGYGLVCLIEGAIMALEGKTLKLKTKKEEKESDSHNKFIKADATKNIGYCSEFIMSLKKPEDIDDNEMKKWLKSMGDSLVYIREDDVLKIHIHVLNPGNLLAKAQEYGEFSKVKVENMTSQVQNEGHLIDKENIISIEKHAKMNEDKLGIVAVLNGSGLELLFNELGVDYIVNGGQTMNPSVNDFKKIIDQMSNKRILLLPNNKNIVLTCKEVEKIYPKGRIIVLETKSLQQGITALYNINKEMVNFEEFMPTVVDSFKAINEGAITKAIRDAKIEDVSVKEGQYISIIGKHISKASNELKTSIITLIDNLLSKQDNPDYLHIYFNDDVPSPLLKEVEQYCKDKYGQVELDMTYGGQGLYHFLVFVE